MTQSLQHEITVIFNNSSDSATATNSSSTAADQLITGSNCVGGGAVVILRRCCWLLLCAVLQLPHNVVGAVGNTLYNMYSYPRVTVRMCEESALTVMMLVLT